jgi:hypothetical protein
MPSAKVIIISSAKTEDEIPSRLKLLRYLPLHKLLSGIVIMKTVKIQEYFLGAHSKPCPELFKRKAKNN